MEDGSWKPKIDNRILEVLISLLKLDNKNRTAELLLPFAKNSDADWPALGQLAAFHHLRPWLYDHYRQLPEGTVPDEVMVHYHGLMDQVRLRQLKNLREFFRVRQALGKAGIPLVPFKGFRLASEYYGDPVLRESSDLDVLIRTGDLQRIIHILTDMGYVPETDWEKHRYPLSHILQLGPEYNMDLWENGQRIAHVEFHWQIATPPLDIPCYYEEMRPFMTTGHFQGKEYVCFTPPGDLLMAAFHHGGKEEWTRLGHILDIALILKKYPYADYGPALLWAQRQRISRIVLVGVQLAHQLCGVDIPATIRDLANDAMIRAIAFNRLDKIHYQASGEQPLPVRLHTALYHFRTRDILASRIGLALSYPEHFIRRAILKIRRR